MYSFLKYPHFQISYTNQLAPSKRWKERQLIAYLIAIKGIDFDNENIRVSLVQLFVKVHNEKVEFSKSA